MPWWRASVAKCRVSSAATTATDARVVARAQGEVVRIADRHGHEEERAAHALPMSALTITRVTPDIHGA